LTHLCLPQVPRGPARAGGGGGDIRLVIYDTCTLSFSFTFNAWYGRPEAFHGLTWVYCHMPHNGCMRLEGGRGLATLTQVWLPSVTWRPSRELARDSAT